jgi:cell division protein FtsW
MTALIKKYLKGDFVIWAVFTLLCIVSIVEMYSALSTLAFKASNHSAPMMRHFSFLALGAIIAYFVHLLPYRVIRIFAYAGLLFSVVTLIIVPFVGVKENDAARWISIFGIQFQPSEFAKLSLIIFAADFISRIKDTVNDENKYFRILLIITGVICALILRENFSTAVLLFAVVYLMMYIGRISLKKLGILAAVMIATAVFGYLTLKAIPEDKLPGFLDRASTWVNRIDRKFEKTDPELEYVMTDENMQVLHGKIAVARGGITGVMPGNSVQRDFLPQAYSDFIYAIIIEETGLIGGVIVILLYMILLYRAGRIATMSKTVFPAILVIGLSLMIVMQALVSMAVATSLGPVTGQPMPLISRGGTSILITSIYFGILLGVTRQIKEDNLPKTEVLIEEDDD